MIEMPTVAFFVGSFPKISETWFTEQVTSLMDLGVDVRIFAFIEGDKDDISEAVKKYKILDRTTYLSYPKNPLFRLLCTPLMLIRLALFSCKSFSPLWRIANLEGFGVAWKYLFWIAPVAQKIEPCTLVHCHFGMIANRYLVVKDLLDLSQPIVTTFYGQDSSKYIQSKGAGVYDRLKKEGNALLVMTEEMKERMIAFGFPSDRVRVHYTGIVLTHYPFVSRHFLPGEVFKIAFVGRFVEKKGIPDLLRTVAIARERYPRIELHIFGGGNDKLINMEISKLTQDLGLSSQVTFHGMVLNDELHKKLPEMHLVVQLSKTAKNGDTDDLPVAILESQATGLPVITTNHVGIPDGLRDGETGFLVEPGDFVAAAEKIMYFIEHPEQVRIMGEKARAFMEERFDLIEIDKKLISLYENLLKTPA